jgi:hypothetical protein
MRGGVPGLQAIDHEGPFAQACGERARGRIAGAAAFVVLQPDVDAPGQEGAGGEHHRGRLEAQAGLRQHAAHAPPR